jgi:uncharacterized protein (DUF58 family)
MPAHDESLALPSPGVAFPADFLERVGRIVVRVSGAGERREGGGKAALLGVGAEFVGYRPYRPGEDLRGLDWNLYARLQKPFVRVARREASEHWAVLLDTSASMGVGVPGKLQRAAELTVVVAALALRQGAGCDVHLAADGATVRVRRRADLAGLMTRLSETRASGDLGLARLLAEPARCRGAGRVFLVGDLLDLEPAAAFRIGRRGRTVFAAQLLAREELDPEDEGAVEWFDPETGDRATFAVDRPTKTSYEGRVSRELEAWRALSARHRAAYGCWDTRTELEDLVADLFEG